jgi:hypothetical protein
VNNAGSKVQAKTLSQWPTRAPVEKEMEEGISCNIEEAFEGLEGVIRLHYVTNCHKKPIDLNQFIE